MVGVRPGLVTGLVSVVVLLAVLGIAPGTGSSGWIVGLVCACVLAVSAARRAGVDQVVTLGPADLVTMTRAVLACGVAALVAESLVTSTEVGGALVPLAVVALALDFVDGRVARRTRTASAYGARLDGEADAFLILVLSIHVAHTAGSWVLAMGMVRYAYAVATWVLPWMQQPLPPRYWRKVVAAFVGTVLVVAASGYAPDPVTYAVLVAAALLLAESFGWDVVWLWRRRPTRMNRTAGRAVPPGKALDRSR